MDVTPLIPKEYNIINGYADNYVLINNVRFNGNLYIEKQIIEEIEAKNLANIVDFIVKNCEKYQNLELILIGIGNIHQNLSFEQKRVLAEVGIKSIETMTSPSVLRSYNMLIAEGRDIGCFICRSEI